MKAAPPAAPPVTLAGELYQQLLLAAAIHHRAAQALADASCKPGTPAFGDVLSALREADRLLSRARVLARRDRTGG